MPTAAEIARNVAGVRERIHAAAARAGRSAEDVTLVAVSKTHGPESILAACDAGLRHFGENRVGEAVQKVPALRSRLPADVVWHMIGHIQSRKSADVPPLFDWVHSVDRPKIARRLSRDAADAGRTLDVLVEVNLSGEASKFGFDLAGWPEDGARFDAVCAALEPLLALPALRWQGLMTLAPYTEDPETVRPLFRRMHALREALRARFPQAGWPHLSMGMSGDFEVAVEEGATMVRVGTAIFGPRE